MHTGVAPERFPNGGGQDFSPAGRPRVVVPVLALPWVSPRMAELCAEHGWSWFDLAGNYRLDVPGCCVSNTRETSLCIAPASDGELEHAGSGAGHPRLLLPEHAGMRWTQREMQKHCQPNVSLGLVNKVVRHLRDEAFIEVGEDGGFRLRDPLKLLFAWRDAYRFDRHERRGYFTLLQGKNCAMRWRTWLADRRLRGLRGILGGGLPGAARASAKDLALRS